MKHEHELFNMKVIIMSCKKSTEICLTKRFWFVYWV